MIRNVLVPIDGSAKAEKAIPWAIAIAGQTGTVHLVHVHVAPVPILIEGVVVSDPTLDLSLREQEKEYSEQLTARIKAASPTLNFEIQNVDSDDTLSEALTKSVQKTAADLVVMTTHGRGPFARFWLGSVSDEFLRHSPVPVLVLRPHDEPTPIDLSTKPQLKHWIVALDGSDLAEKILEPAIQLGTCFGADFTLALVLESLSDPEAIARIEQPDLPESLNPTTASQRAEMYLERIARMIAERKGSAHTRLVREGSPAEVLQHLSGKDPSTGIALATHGRAGLSRLLLGSVADEVVRKAHGPVLVYHPSV